ncbi:hypothetical protein Tco_0527347 [Tanacetum coccineum]
MTNTHQQSLAYAGLENRPPMLEKGSYVLWLSEFMRYIDGKKESRKVIKDSIVNGPYVIKEIHDSTSTLEDPIKRLKVVDDLTGDEKNSMMQTLMNQAIVQANHVDIQSENVGNSRRFVRRTIGNKVDVTGNAMNVQRILRTTANSGNGLNIHLYNCNAKGHYARDYPKPKVCDSKYFQEQLLLAKKYEAGIILEDKQNDFQLANASEVEEFKDLNATYHEQPEIIKPTIDDDQINSDIIFDDLNMEVNNGQVAQDNNDHDQRHAEIELLIKDVQIESEKQ